MSVFLNIWNRIETNKVFGAMWPNDGDGNARAGDVGLPKPATEVGYR